VSAQPLPLSPQCSTKTTLSVKKKPLSQNWSGLISPNVQVTEV